MDNLSAKSKCVYCGNNPVPHFLNWYNGSMMILLEPLRGWLFNNFITRRLKRQRFGQSMGWGLVWLLEKFRVIVRQKNRELCKVARAQVLWEEAEKRNIEMQELLLFGRPFDCYVAEKKEISNYKLQISNEGQRPKAKGQRLVFSGLPRPASSTESLLDEMDDKWFLKKLFIKNNLPVPVGAAVTNFRQARKIFKHIQVENTIQEPKNKNQTNLKSKILNLKSAIPVIVKPRIGSRGRHSTTFVCTEKDLKQAVKTAKQLNFWVMVEEQLAGPVYRATLIDFKLRGVLRGDPPQVTGDGTHTIGQLIRIKNSLPHPGVKDVVISEEMGRFIERESRNKSQEPNLKNQINSKIQNPNVQKGSKDMLGCIPEAGEVINLSEKIGVNYGGSSSEDLYICHPDNKELFVRAAQVVGEPIVGFDFIIGDITKSYKEQRCGFIEANSLPFINLHHDPLLGRPQNVAKAVWEMIGW